MHSITTQGENKYKTIEGHIWLFRIINCPIPGLWVLHRLFHNSLQNNKLAPIFAATSQIIKIVISYFEHQRYHLIHRYFHLCISFCCFHSITGCEFNSFCRLLVASLIHLVYHTIFLHAIHVRFQQHYVVGLTILKIQLQEALITGFKQLKWLIVSSIQQSISPLIREMYFVEYPRKNILGQ